ncbi:PQQ-dependent sugar dehydrogenase [Salinimicrobium soli]|uniref:PQQ-dependent sugar dehydrogenase n=1 Tax=Salinimicrobium soli TaxID=1254399 RepID=UPI003AABB24D
MEKSTLSRRYIRGYTFLTALMVLTFFACNSDDDNDVRQEPTQSLDLLLVADNLVSPVGLTESPDDSGRLFVIDQAGMIWLINADGTKQENPYLDVRSRMVSLGSDYDERGLLGLAFHPDFAVNGKFYVYYTAPPNAGGPEEGASWNNISRISEFTVSDPAASQAELSTERIVLDIDQPQGNHEGGTIAFGPDGYLYISIGDGGAADDVAPGHVEDWYEANAGGNGQDIEENLLGNILRIDVNGALPYSIPGDNPFVGEDPLPEIYAYGFRNPFRFSFDMGGSNRLFVGDAGQSLWEEISVVEAGGNYGWNVKEGSHCFDASDNKNIPATCPDTDVYGTPLTDPVIELPNAANPAGGVTVTVIGGYVYRGNSIPDLNGQYLFGSFSKDFQPTGEVYISNPTGAGPWTYEEVNFKSYADNLGYYLKGFGQDMDGEMYLAVSSQLGPAGNTGKIFKLVLVND